MNSSPRCENNNDYSESAKRMFYATEDQKRIKRMFFGASVFFLGGVLFLVLGGYVSDKNYDLASMAFLVLSIYGANVAWRSYFYSPDINDLNGISCPSCKSRRTFLGEVWTCTDCGYVWR